MASLLLGPQFKLYVVCCFILCLLMFALGFLTAKARADKKTYANPEDGPVFPTGATYNEGNDPPEVTRVMRAHRNLIESLLPFSMLGLIYVLVGAPLLGAEICFGVFTVARVLHAIVYLKGVQPLRTATFAIGILAMVGMMVLSAMALFR
jgi:prostaglandin-E synthase 1